MKVITLLLSILFCINILNAQKRQGESPKEPRIEKYINSQWTFNYFPSELADKGYEQPGLNDSRWPAVSIPHTWNSYETTGELLPFTRSPGETGETFWWTGWGWYRKHILIDASYSDHSIFLEFEGISKYCKVWVNGKYAGDHKGGYGSFDFDITGFVKPGADNLIAVAVSNLQKDEFRLHPVTSGNLNVSCGIYRNVKLVIKNKLYIPMQGAAAHEGGTFITTTMLSDKEASVNVRTWVKNDYSEAKTCLLQTTLSDMNNQVVQVLKTEATIDPGQIYIFNQTSKPVKNPHLWSPSDPYLYTVNSEVIDKKDVSDAIATAMGFRSFRIDKADNSIYINDSRTELKGVRRHREYPWLGDAVPQWMIPADYQETFSNSGINFINTINFPGSSAEYDMADRKGVIAEEDYSALSQQGFTPEEQKGQIAEMIRRDRNHPSIIAWDAGDARGKDINAMTIAAEDSTRLTGTVPFQIVAHCTFYLPGNSKKTSDSLSSGIVKPSRIFLIISNEKITADRGSIVSVIANIGDSTGKVYEGASNCLRWKVSGPAKLVGPAYYVSYADSGRSQEEGFYTEMPARNLIRSTGKAGRIVVTVFSAGLASGSAVIDAVEAEAGNSMTAEPKLADEGRKPVTKSNLVTERLDEIPQEILPASTDISLSASDIKGFSALITAEIIKNNPAADTASVEFKTLSGLLALQLFNNGGHLSSADFNFNAEHYNNCRLISGYILRTKLPSLFKESLRGYYSRQLIVKGCEKNAGDEMNWLNWIPSGGIVVIVPDENTVKNQKGVVYTKETGLPEIIRAVYPQFAKFSQEARERALIFISKMNPAVHVKYPVKGVFGGGTETEAAPVFTSEKGQPVLIPDFKFISE